MELTAKSLLIGLFVFILIVCIIVFIVYFLNRPQVQPTAPPGTTKNKIDATPISIGLDDGSTTMGFSFPLQYVMILVTYINVSVSSQFNSKITDYYLTYSYDPSFTNKSDASLFINPKNNVLCAYFENFNYLTAQADDQNNVFFDVSNANTDLQVDVVPGDDTKVPDPTSTFTTPPDPLFFTYLQCNDPTMFADPYYLILEDQQDISRSNNPISATPVNNTISTVTLQNYEFSIAPLLTNDGEYITINSSGNLITYTDNFVYNETNTASLFLCPDKTLKAAFSENGILVFYQLHGKDNSYLLTKIIQMNNFADDDEYIPPTDWNFLTFSLADSKGVVKLILYPFSNLSVILNATKYYLYTDDDTNQFSFTEDPSTAQNFLITYGQIYDKLLGVRNVLVLLNDSGSYISVNLKDFTMDKSITFTLWSRVEYPPNFYPYASSTNSLVIPTDIKTLMTMNITTNTVYDDQGKKTVKTFINYFTFQGTQKESLFILGDLSQGGVMFNIEMSKNT